MSYYAADPRDTRPAPGKLQCPQCKHWYFESDFEGNLCQSCDADADEPDANYRDE